jgi:hypothetical protein
VTTVSPAGNPSPNLALTYPKVGTRPTTWLLTPMLGVNLSHQIQPGSIWETDWEHGRQAGSLSASLVDYGPRTEEKRQKGIEGNHLYLVVVHFFNSDSYVILHFVHILCYTQLLWVFGDITIKLRLCDCYSMQVSQHDFLREVSFFIELPNRRLSSHLRFGLLVSTSSERSL